MKGSAFLNALPIVAQAIGESADVKVHLNAGNPRTDGRNLYLPAIASDNPRDRILALGWTTHECGHIADSDFSLEFASPLEKSLDNVLEDIRIEQIRGVAYPGCRGFLADTVRVMTEEGMWERLDDDSHPAKVVSSFMLFKLRLRVLNQTAVEELAADAERRLVDKFPEGMRIRLEALMFEVENCQSESDVRDLAREIIKMMGEEAEKEENKEQNEAQQDQSQSGGSPDQTPQPQGQGESEGSGDGNPDSGSGAAGDDQAGEGSQAGGAADANAGGAQPASSTPRAAGDGGMTPSGAIRQALSAGAGDTLQDSGEILQAAVAKAENRDAPSSVGPFKNVPYSGASRADAATIAAYKNRVAAGINALKVRAQGLLCAIAAPVRRTAYTGNRLNVRTLHLAALGGPVFVRKTQGQKTDTAVALLVDRSQSMAKEVDGLIGQPPSTRIGLAMDGALATTLAFEMPEVKTAVFSFPYVDASTGEVCNAVVKTWNQRPAAAIPAYQALGAAGNTPLAEAMMAACIALAGRPEARKILVVNTDGEPDDKAKCDWVIDGARRAGIEILGLGIGLDVSARFGQQWSGRIDDIRQLPAAMIGMLNKVMLKKAA